MKIIETLVHQRSELVILSFHGPVDATVQCMDAPAIEVHENQIRAC